MSREAIILVGLWVISIGILFKISRGRMRETQITFIFSQAVAWVFVYLLVFFRMVTFPYREFPKATDMSFSFYFVIFPTIAVLFVTYFPKKKGRARIFIYYFLYAMIIPTFLVFVERYTDMIHFVKWNWFFHVLADFLVLYIIKRFAWWFQKGLQ